jgi:hypothetical protein
MELFLATPEWINPVGLPVPNLVREFGMGRRNWPAGNGQQFAEKRPEEEGKGEAGVEKKGR